MNRDVHAVLGPAFEAVADTLQSLSIRLEGWPELLPDR
jgi:hypothetical protein